MGKQDVELAIPLKYLGNFWRALNIPLISCEVSLELKWNKKCVITSLQQVQVNAGSPAVNRSPTGAKLAIIDCKLYVPVVTLTNVNRLFVLAYQTADNRQSFSQFYLSKVMVKDFNVIIDKLAFFDLPIKTEEEAYEKIIHISRNNEYTTGNLLDYGYFKKYKLIAIDLSKQQVLQENEDLIQQINFISRLEEAAHVFIIIEKKENTILEFSQNFANVLYT